MVYTRPAPGRTRRGGILPLHALLAPAYLAAAAFLIFCLVWPASAAAADVAVVQAEATAAKTEEEADAKKAALEGALRGAVREALAMTGAVDETKADPEAVAAEISSEPRRFILNYRILSEGWTTERTPMGAVGPGAGEGDVLVPSEIWPGQEYEPADPNALWSDDEARWDDEGTGEPRSLYHIKIEARVDIVHLRGAVATVLSRGSEGLETITVLLLDAVDYPTYSRFSSALERVPMVKEVSYDSFYRGRISFKVRSTGTSLELKQVLSRELGRSYVVQFGGPQTITLRAMGAARAR